VILPIAALELDDIIFNLQRFGGVSTYWREVTSRLPSLVHGVVVHTTGSKYGRFSSPKSNAKIFHSSYFRVARGKNTRNVITVHDLIYEKGMQTGMGAVVNSFERKRAVLRADAIICISESTKNDLLEYYGRSIYSKNIDVIYHGNSLTRKVDFSEIDQNRVNAVSKTSFKDYFLFVGGRSGYKNFEVALQAFCEGKFSRQGLQLVCTGTQFSKYESSIIRQLNIEKFVIACGTVSSEEMIGLYKNAIALIYPSSYEGFGLPPLEAMASGCPVIYANSSSLPEVVGDAGVMCEPLSVDQLIDSMSYILDKSIRQTYIVKGLQRSSLFSWDESARKHASFYRQLF
jgi:glycosyltransferase involved in cell wall biosynthesis